MFAKENVTEMLRVDVIIFLYEVPCIFLHYISVDEESWITLKKLLQSAMDSYYKLRQLFCYKVRCGLLQIATGITKWDDYYKLRQYKDQFVTENPQGGITENFGRIQRVDHSNLLGKWRHGGGGGGGIAKVMKCY